MAYDAASGLFYVNANEMPWILRMVKIGAPGAGAPAGLRTYQAFCATCHGENRQGEPIRNVPAIDDVESRLSRSAVASMLFSLIELKPRSAARRLRSTGNPLPAIAPEPSGSTSRRR